jgi:DNA (cytosine-5)-methyltransferase 1
MFTVVSTFSGCGGSSLGYQLAGGKVLLAVEWNQNAVDTYRANFPNTDIYHGDISKLSVDEVLKRTNLKPRELDIFDGSPPCQGFSTAGKREISDKRNQLFREYVRLLRGLQPKVFVMENVSGMVKGKMRLIFVEILKEMKESGYQVKAKLLNAMYFNVPQSRQRMIFIGVRNDIGIEPSYPNAQTKPICFGEALKSVNYDADDYRTLPSDRVLLYCKHHRGGWNTNEKTMINLSKKTHSISSLKFSERNKLLGTIRKSEIVDGGIIHPDKKRYLSMNELKAGGSFPQTFEFFNRKNAI